MQTRARPAVSGSQGSINREHRAPSPPLINNEEQDYNELDDENYEETEAEDTNETEVAGNQMDRFMQLLRQNLELPPQPRQPQPPHQVMANAFKSFKSVRPSEFHGVADPVQARAWLKEMEKTFERIGTEEAHKTNFATYLLKGEANY